MRIYITDKEEIREIRLQEWDNTTDSWAWGCQDMFGDLAVNYPSDYPVRVIGTDASCAMTDEQYRAEVAWWEEECRKYNNRERSFFTEYGDEDAEFAKDHQMILNADL